MFDVRSSEAENRVFEFDFSKNEHVQVCSIFEKNNVCVSLMSNLVNLIMSLTILVRFPFVRSLKLGV